MSTSNNRTSRPRRRFRWARALAAGRRGAAAVEFAFIAPMLFLVVLGLMEFGIFAWNRHSLEFATEETARAVMTKTSTTASAVEADLKSRVSGISSAALTATVTQETVGPTTFVTMNITYTYNYFLLGSFLGLAPIVFQSQTRVPLRQSS